MALALLCHLHEQSRRPRTLSTSTMPRVTPRSRRLRFLRLNLALIVSQVIRDAIAESYIDLDNSSDMDSDNMDDSDSSDDSSDDEGLFDTDLSSEYIEAVFLVRGGKSRGRAKPFNDAMGDPSSLKTRLEICAYELLKFLPLPNSVIKVSGG